MRRSLSCSLCLLFALCWPAAAQDSGRSFTLTVEAGDYDRRASVVPFSLPQGLKRDGLTLRDGQGEVQWQHAADGTAMLVIEELKQGGRKTFVLSESDVRNRDRANQISAGKVNERVEFVATGAERKSRPLFSYQAEPGAFPRDDIKPEFRRGGYLHPIRTPSGKIVTDDFPTNHVHHHGVWWAWTNTEFDGRKTDFWNMGAGNGRVEFVSLDETWSGRVHAGFRSKHRFIDLTSGKPVIALNESWQVTAYASSATSSHWMFDLVSEQHCATEHGLKLPEYRYGGVGVRGNWAWNGKDKTDFLTSEGETDRVKGHATRARWCYMGGQLDGASAGMAILCHPLNFRAPQPMRLHPTEPFFNYAPQQAGDMEIKPGEKYVSRYRFVVLDGAPVKAELDRLWNDYAHPPIVKVEER